MRIPWAIRVVWLRTGLFGLVIALAYGTSARGADPETSPASSPAAAPSPASQPEPVLPTDALPAADTRPGGGPPPQNALPLFSPESSDQPQPTPPATTSQVNGKPATTSLSLMDPLALTALQQAESNAETLFTGVGGIPRPLSSLYLNRNLDNPQGIRRGDLIISPSISLGTNYYTSSGDQNGSGSTDFYGLLSPAIGLSLGEPSTGKIIKLQYLGSLVLGQQGDRKDPYDQSLAAVATLNFTKLNLGFGVQYSQLGGSDRDFGGRDVNRNLLGVSFTSSYQYSEKTGFESNLTVPVRLFGEGTSTEGVTSTSFFNYFVSPLTTLGVGFSGGATFVEGGRTQTFQQILGRLTFLGTGSLVINGAVGVEFRDTGYEEQITPVVGAGVAWEVREGTSLILSIDRRVFGSAAVKGADYTSSSVTLSATQRLGDFVQANGSIGYENATYDNLGHGAEINRDDNFVVVQAGLSATIASRWAVSATASYGVNSSTGNGLTFFQSALQLTYTY